MALNRPIFGKWEDNRAELTPDKVEERLWFSLDMCYWITQKKVRIRNLQGLKGEGRYTIVTIQYFSPRRYLGMYRYTLFYTAANVHSTAKQLLQIIHTSLTHRKSFHVMPSERWIPAKVFMLGQTGTNEPQMGR